MLRTGDALVQFLIEDHERLDALLDRALARPRVVERAAYAELRSGLVRHMAIEERLVLPALRDGDGDGVARRVELEHRALAALLMPTPTPALVRALRAILHAHEAGEEDEGGLHAACARLPAGEAEALVAAARAVAPVPLAAHADGPWVAGELRRALVRAGYALEDYESVLR